MNHLSDSAKQTRSNRFRVSKKFLAVEERIRNLAAQGFSKQQIASELNIYPLTLSEWLVKFEIPIKNSKKNCPAFVLSQFDFNDYKEKINDMLSNGISFKRIRLECNITHHVLNAWVKQHHLKKTKLIKKF